MYSSYRFQKIYQRSLSNGNEPQFVLTILLNVNFVFISTGIKTVLGQYELFIDRNTRAHLAWTIGNRDPMHNKNKKIHKSGKIDVDTIEGELFQARRDYICL